MNHLRLGASAAAPCSAFSSSVAVFQVFRGLPLMAMTVFTCNVSFRPRKVVTGGSLPSGRRNALKIDDNLSKMFPAFDTTKGLYRLI